MSAAAVQTGAAAVTDLSRRTGYSHAQIMRTVRMIGGAMIGLAIMVVVLNEVFSIGSFETYANNSSYKGPFGSIIGSLESTGSAALGLLVIGLLVLAANQVMGFFGGGGF
jgi:uncharacterized membrane protein YesL